jgi:stage V sporulation protein R
VDTKLIRRLQQEILEYVLDYGLDPFEVIFEMIDFDQMNEIASYGGFPTRFPHWRFGMEYEALRKGYRYGLQKIYELVINNDPCYAYLMKSNSEVDQKMVIAHVYAHSDFFKNNLWFSQTNRKMLDEIANHGTRIRRYIEKYGEDVVEGFIDLVLSLENLIDYHSVYFPQRREEEHETDRIPVEIGRLKSKEYMDRFINPPEYLALRHRKREEERDKKHKKFPEEPKKDVLLFLLEEAPIENWQRDIIGILREEAYYFAPQALTKIMNEGWATYWHSKIMTQKCLKEHEFIDYADHHSGTVGGTPGGLNPYKLGLELFRDIEERWNKGKFGREYEECDDIKKRSQWDLRLGLGMEKIFQVRRIYNDITFIDEFFTEEFCQQQKIFLYKYNPQTGRYEITNRDFKTIKKELLFKLTNLGHPIIYVEDANFQNRSELLLVHRHEGVDLDLEDAKDTLKNLYKIWQRPVNLQTRIEDLPKLLSYNGQEFLQINQR